MAARLLMPSERRAMTWLGSSTTVAPPMSLWPASPCSVRCVWPGTSRPCNALKVRRHAIGSWLLLAILLFVSAGSRCWKPEELPWAWWFIPVPA